EKRAIFAPVARHFKRALAPGQVVVLLYKPSNDLLVLVARHSFKLNQLAIAAPFKLAVKIEHICDSSGHAGGEVLSHLTKHHHKSRGHVFTTVTPDSFNT